MNNYKFAGIDTFDINNGKGFGVTFFVQGCPHHCKDCHNPSTWDFDGGRKLTADIIQQLEALFKDPNIVRLTMSGGEPFANIDVTYSICSMFKNVNPGKQLWVYTGYYLEALLENPQYEGVLSLCDILVDGPFEADKRDLSLPFRGSSNQRIIDMNRTRESGDIVLVDC